MPASRRSSAGGSAAASRSADLPRPASTPPTFSVGLITFSFWNVSTGTGSVRRKIDVFDDHQTFRYDGISDGWGGCGIE